MKKHLLSVSSSFLFLVFTASAQSSEGEFKDFIATQSGRMSATGSIPTFTTKDDTKGSRYLYTKWVKGSVWDVQGRTYNTDKVWFNFDKINTSLIVKLDTSTFIEANANSIGAFTLTDGTNEYHFEHLKNVPGASFYLLLVKSDNGYSAYKQVHTVFKKADYHTDGYSETGHRYDEYEDGWNYYILTPQKDLINITLKEKSIKKALEDKQIRVDDFFSTHKGDKVDDEYIKKLVNFLNSK